MGKQKQSHLLEFYGIDCDHCVDMEPLIRKLREEEGQILRRFERLDVGSACGGVPYFYNKQTRGWICGATTYPNFRNWALGYKYERFLPPPKEEETGKKTQAPGAAGLIESVKSFFERVKSEGLEQIQKRTDETAKGSEGEEPKPRNTLPQRGAFTFPPRRIENRRPRPQPPLINVRPGRGTQGSSSPNIHAAGDGSETSTQGVEINKGGSFPFLLY